MQTRSSPNIQTLHRLAAQASIPNYEKFSKKVLFTKLKEQFDIDRLLRKEIRRSKLEDIFHSKKRKSKEHKEKISHAPLSSSSSPPIEKVKLNKFDPIMLTPIGKKNCFKFVRPNGTVVRFNIESLVDFLLASGDFHDPETRLPFSDNDLREIDALANKAGLGKPSVLEAKSNIHSYSESKFRRDALLALERCAGEVITDMLQIVETYEPDEAQMQLAMREFPTFQDYFRQLKDADPPYASKCISHWYLFIEGPPNRPNKDEYGLINVVCQFLKNCDNDTTA